jgi:microcystin-dependent protein
VFGVDNMGGSDAGRLSVANTLGTTTGAETITIASGNLPVHTHSIEHNHGAFNATSGGQSAGHTHAYTSVYRYTGNVDYGNYYDGYYPTGATTGANSVDHNHTTSIDVPNFTGTSGDGGFANTALNKMPPTIILNYIIKD